MIRVFLTTCLANNLKINHIIHRLIMINLIFRDQLTTTEVNMARVYNWNVKKRQAANATS